METFIEYVGGDTNWFECLCGNEPDTDGFFPCKVDGTIVTPELNGEWNGELYVCARCNRIIDGQSLKVEGVCSEQVAHANTNFDWSTF